MGYWNIQGTRDKLENDLVREWVLRHDIVVLTETKTQASPSMPGYVAIPNCSSRHGGVAVLVRRRLFPYVQGIETHEPGVIWFELSTIPGICFCGMFNEPADSTYFRPETYASIPAHLTSGQMCVVGGDMNARMGQKAQELAGEYVQRYNVVDEGTNTNGRMLLQTCKDNDLVVANNLVTMEGRTLQSGLSFRKKKRWISELDLCMVSRQLSDSLVDLTMNQDLGFPSDHAPLSVKYSDTNFNHLVKLGLIINFGKKS